MLVGDLDFTGLEIGDEADLGPAGTKTVVGAYRLPESESDFWSEPQRLASKPRTFDDVTFEVTPYEPAPPDRDAGGVRRAAAVAVGGAWSTVASTYPPTPAPRTCARPWPPPRDWRDHPNRSRVVPSSVTRSTTCRRSPPRPGRSSRSPVPRSRRGLALVLVALALLLRLLMSAAELRLPELALASLRGLPPRGCGDLASPSRSRWLALSVPVGVVIGCHSLVLVRWWLAPGLPLPLPGESVVAALLALVAAFGVSVLAVGLVLRSSLSEQLTGVRRPHATGAGQPDHPARPRGRCPVGALGEAGKVSRPGRAGGHRPAPAGARWPWSQGFAATHVTARLPGWWTRARPRTRSLPAFVAARAISRRMEGTLVILPVTAAIAVCVFGADVHESAAQWRASVAATTAPAGEVGAHRSPWTRRSS